MDMIIKIILSCLLSVTTVSKLNERYVEIVTATKTDKSGIGLGQYENSAQDVTDNEQSVFSASNHLEITASFLKKNDDEESALTSNAVVEESSYLDNTQISSELSAASEVVVLPSADTVGELKNVLKSSQVDQVNVNNSNYFFTAKQNENEDYVVPAEPKFQGETFSNIAFDKDADKNGSMTVSNEGDEYKESSTQGPQHQDIPSFSEWTQKQLAEAEKKKSDQNETSERFTRPRGKIRVKNYASPDCGAKIVAANPESLSSSSVLSSLKDEYMLNYCANRIWFIVELCEAIQAKQLDLANFELFSSSPKHFSVYVSHRFPTREWSNVGKFTAEDSRDVQTFNLHPHFFGKFVKVEMHSHYGKEQFCPISWVGIYGTSEYEVLAKEDERHLLTEDDDGDPYDEEIFLGHKRDSPKNLFSSATDAVLSIVKKATAPFMKSENNETESKNSTETSMSRNAGCLTPRYIIVCNNCSQDLYDKVFSTLSCEYWNLESVLDNSFVRHTLVRSDYCIQFGLDFSDVRSGAPYMLPSSLGTSEQGIKYLTTMLKNAFVAALCNALAVSENKVVMNVTRESIESLKNLTQKKEFCEEMKPTTPRLPVSSSTYSCNEAGECLSPASTDSQHTTPVLEEMTKPNDEYLKKIEPTKTLTEAEIKMFFSSDLNGEIDSGETEKKPSEYTNTQSDTYVSSSAVVAPAKDAGDLNSSEKKEDPVPITEHKDDVQSHKEMDTESKSSNAAVNQDPSLESIISDLNAIEKVVNSPSNTFPSSASYLPTESIFLRLANRIKNLEINMSLSSTYLEELSRRYRTQLELISKTLNLTIQKVEEHSKLEEEKERKREKEMVLIRMQLANLTRDVSTFFKEKNSWQPRASSVSQHIFFISVETLLIWIVINYWKKGAAEERVCERRDGTKRLSKKYKRRSSLEGVKGHEMPKRKVRRPSDEALDIALSRTYRSQLKIDKKRKRRKKDSKCSLNGVQPKRKESEVDVPDVYSRHPQVPENSSSSLPMSKEVKSESIPLGLGTKEADRPADRSAPPAYSKPIDNCHAMTKTLQSFASPVFMKTALAARHSRMRLGPDKDSSQEFHTDQDLAKRETQKERKGSNSLKKYMKKFF